MEKEQPQKGENQHEDKGAQSRRDFLKKLGLIGTASVAGAAAMYTGFHYEQSKGKGDKVKVLTADNKLVEVDKSALKDSKPSLEVFQERGREGIPGKRWVMVIDLSKCRNARQCVTACQSAHRLRPYEYHINT